MSQASAGPASPARGAAPKAGAAEPAVLVIDDSRVIRRAIAKVLAGEFTLIEAEDGEAGWAHIRTNPAIQVVISDVEMPRLDGYGLIERVRAAEEERIRGLPVIVITGAQDEPSRERAFACGATDFITKPIDGVQLLARARSHARLDRATRQLSEATRSLAELSAVDPLTELHSRRYFLQRATQDIAFARRHGQDVAVIRLEFDDFRAVYQRYGDETCDRMFVWLAGLMRANTRTEDTAARIRGGEFAILAPSSDRQEARALCERLRRAVAGSPFPHESGPASLTISLGLATLKGDRAGSIEELLAAAEQRLAQTKAAGGNQLGIGYEDAPAPAEEAGAAPDAREEAPDLDTAASWAANGEGPRLRPHLPDLLGRLRPLLEFAERELALGLGDALRRLRGRTSRVK